MSLKLVEVPTHDPSGARRIMMPTSINIKAFALLPPLHQRISRDCERIKDFLSGLNARHRQSRWVQ
jgi:hypothetical protein